MRSKCINGECSCPVHKYIEQQVMQCFPTADVEILRCLSFLKDLVCVCNDEQELWCPDLPF